MYTFITLFISVQLISYFSPVFYQTSQLHYGCDKALHTDLRFPIQQHKVSLTLQQFFKKPD